MTTPGPPNQFSGRRPRRNSRFLLALIIIGEIIVSLQYTPYALFPSEKSSMLWGMLTGLVLGGFLFGWLKLPMKD